MLTKHLSIKVFGNDLKRKKAKILFLSYTYGMSLDNILGSVQEAGGDLKKAREYFSGFSVFESWKETVWKEFFDNGRVATVCANYLNRSSKDDSSDKEKRTSVNHVVQGTATYIFKRALLELSKMDGVQILIPMHDAVLYQHEETVDPSSVVKLFEDVMTDELRRKIKGKASIEKFFVE